MKINLNDVIEAIEYENDVLNHFYNKNTGIIIYQDNSEESSYNAEDINNIENKMKVTEDLLQRLLYLTEENVVEKLEEEGLI